MPKKRAKHWGRPVKPIAVSNPDTGLRQLPLNEYERRYGPVNDFQRIEGGHVLFVIERPGVIRFLRMLEAKGTRYHP